MRNLSKEEKEQLYRLGRYARAIRRAKDLTQDDLAEQMGYSAANGRSTISAIERGRVDLPATRIRQLATALGVAPTALLDAMEPSPSE